MTSRSASWSAPSSQVSWPRGCWSVAMRSIAGYICSRPRTQTTTVCPISTSLEATEATARAYTDLMLEQIRGPADLQHLSQSELSDLAREIREFLIHKVAATGGHLGPNLGVVELTLALHRVFDSPHDPIVFDTGHQAYVHKMLTGRAADFETLRKKGGLSGYPSRAESEHDWVESSHASAALSYADGLAKAFELTGHRNRHV